MIKYLFVITAASILFIDNSLAQFHAVCIPPEKINSIKIDGNLSDWNWIHENDKLKTDIFFERLNNLPSDTKNFDVELAIAWSSIENRIYIICELHDNNVIDDDGVIIVVNPTNAEGHYWMNGAFAHFNIMAYYLKFKNDTITSGLHLGPEWAKKTEFFNWAVKTNREDSIVIYEISFPLWRKWSDKGPDFSKEYYLKSNNNIGLMIAFTDKDSTSKASKQWSYIYEQNYWFDARSIAYRFILDPYISKKPSWEGIKHVLK